MPKFPPLKCVAVESDQEADPVALDQAMDILCHWAIREYFARHPEHSALKPKSFPEDSPSQTTSPQATPLKADRPEGRLVDVATLSRYLSLPKATIYTWVSLRKFPPGVTVRLGRSLRFDLREVDLWIETKKRRDQSAAT